MITRKRVPEILIEVKTSDTALSKSLEYYASRIACPALQLVLDTERRIARHKGQILPVAAWLAQLEC